MCKYIIHMYVYKVCPEGIQACTMKKIEPFIEEDTRYKKHCTQDNDTSVPFKVGTLGPHSFPSHYQLPCCIFLNLIDGLKSLPFQR